MPSQKAAKSLIRLLNIMATLRSPNGCPWDADQTPESLRPFLLEETHEVLEAISIGDPKEICSELGDLLLQIIFQARIFEEKKEFDFSDVAESIAEKLVRRHPHVFSGGDKRTGRELDRQWQAIKDKERKNSSHAPPGGSRIPQTLPSLARAAKILGQIGLFRKGESEALRKTLVFQLQPLLEDFFQNPEAATMTETEYGKMLLFLVDAGIRNHLDAEESLRSVLLRLETHGTLE